MNLVTVELPLLVLVVCALLFALVVVDGGLWVAVGLLRVVSSVFDWLRRRPRAPREDAPEGRASITHRIRS